MAMDKTNPDDSSFSFTLKHDWDAELQLTLSPPMCH